MRKIVQYQQFYNLNFEDANSMKGVWQVHMLLLPPSSQVVHMMARKLLPQSNQFHKVISPSCKWQLSPQTGWISMITRPVHPVPNPYTSD